MKWLDKIEPLIWLMAIWAIVLIRSFGEEDTDNTAMKR